MLLGLQLLECFSFSCKTTAKRAIIGWKEHQPIKLINKVEIHAK